VQLLRALPRSSLRSLDRFDAVYKLLEHLRVVDAGGCEYYREWDSVSIRYKMELRALFAMSRQIPADSFAPSLVWTEALSKLARSRSVRSDLPRRSKSTCCRRRHTPASCHSLRRRPQVPPEPQLISLGNNSQGMPLFRTKTMPVSTALPDTEAFCPWA
jgi:hypothetical protein